ncbi:magnesium chelatase domain-containing protein [Humitalea sp. 24SJ18S-53]|uniref:magnesium chelatase domain-containing protein n=1 Tax=Humitalea sp. 24SJ18S-53 TaxID=3422307 RepID=UPI003D66F2D0
MISRVATFAFTGMEPQPVEVQVQISAGMPAFTLVGLGDKAVGESRERVRAALASLGLSLPPKRVLVNLAPADLAKEGSHYDLPIALALLAAMELFPIEDLARFAALGELALDGALLPVPGVLPAALAAAGRDLGLICPASQGGEAAWAGPVEVLAPPNLATLLAHMRGTQPLMAPKPSPPLDRAADALCLSQVKGQETAKRALEVAAAGGHNLILLVTRAPSFGDLADCGVAVAVACRRCGWRCGLDARLEERRGRGHLGALSVSAPCGRCGGIGGEMLFGGLGWYAGPVAVPCAPGVLPYVRLAYFGPHRRPPPLPWTRPAPLVLEPSAGGAV